MSIGASGCEPTVAACDSCDNRSFTNAIVRENKTIISTTSERAMSTNQLPDLESLACVDALARTLKFHAA
ncbi:MAG TPA: hypothetical protein VGO62_12860, partial [Myxococcota bacterium]